MKKILISPSSFGQISEKPYEILTNNSFEIIKNPFGRKLTENEVIEAIKSCEIIFEETDARFGKKKYSKFPLGMKSLIVVWFINIRNEEELITAYWRTEHAETINLFQ